jgi:hypothetical protein
MVWGKSIHVLPCQLRTVAQKTIHATHYHRIHKKKMPKLLRRGNYSKEICGH